MVCDIPGVYAAAAKGEDGCIVIANTGSAAVPLELEADGTVSSCRIIDGENSLTEIPLPEVLEADTILCITVK